MFKFDYICYKDCEAKYYNFAINIFPGIYSSFDIHINHIDGMVLLMFHTIYFINEKRYYNKFKSIYTIHKFYD